MVSHGIERLDGEWLNGWVGCGAATDVRLEWVRVDSSV